MKKEYKRRKINGKIKELTIAFAYNIVNIIRNASLQDILTETGLSHKLLNINRILLNDSTTIIPSLNHIIEQKKLKVNTKTKSQEAAIKLRNESWTKNKSAPDWVDIENTDLDQF